MTHEWRKIINVHPAVLYKKDVIELVKILTECEPNQTYNLSIQYEYEGLRQTMSSEEELLEFSKEEPTNSLFINVTTRDNNKIINGVSLTMYHNYITYQIHSESEPWFLGKISQLTTFFKKNKPWYALITKIIPFAGPSLVMSGVYLFLSSINKSILAASFFLFFTISMAIISFLAYNNRIFPFVRIVPSDQKKRIFTTDLVSIIIAVLSLIVSIIGTIVIPMLSKGIGVRLEN